MDKLLFYLSNGRGGGGIYAKSHADNLSYKWTQFHMVANYRPKKIYGWGVTNGMGDTRVHPDDRANYNFNY